MRNVMWTFEDIHMLVGSNMPIFGGGRYPAVSLRLRLESFILFYLLIYFFPVFHHLQNVFEVQINYHNAKA